MSMTKRFFAGLAALTLVFNTFAATAALQQGSAGLAQATAVPGTTSVGRHAPEARINCGFICDSFGRCYRVCW
jgi:hypothetical protein